MPHPHLAIASDSLANMPRRSRLLRRVATVAVLSVSLTTLSGCASISKLFGSLRFPSADSAPKDVPAAAEPEKPAEPVPCADCAKSVEPAATPVAQSAASSEPIAAMPAPAPAPQAEAPVAAPAVAAAVTKPAKSKPAVEPKATHPKKEAVAAPSSANLAPGFHINVGLFAVPSNAHNAYQKLVGAGMAAYTQDLKTSKGKLTRVRVGPFESRADADAAADKIHSLNLEAVVFQR